MPAGESVQKTTPEQKGQWKSSKPSKISVIKDVEDNADIITSPIKKKKEKDLSSPDVRHSPCLSAKNKLQSDNSSSDDGETPLLKVFRELDWFKIVPENKGLYTIYVGETPVTVTVGIPVGHSSPKSIASNNDLNTDDTRGDQSIDLSCKQIELNNPESVADVSISDTSISISEKNKSANIIQTDGNDDKVDKCRDGVNSERNTPPDKPERDINPQGDLQGALVNSESNTTGDKEVEKSGSLPEKPKEDINAQVEHKGENVNSESNTPPDKPEKDINPQGDPQGALVNSESNAPPEKPERH